MVTANSDGPTVDLATLAARLDRIERKLDYVVERQRFTEDLIDEMTPVAREALGWGTELFGEAERKGWFAVARELVAIADKVVETYGPGEVEQLGVHIVELMDTVKNVTQPDVLAVANDATDVLHNADQIRPVGMFGVARATGDAEVQRGMAIALHILKQLGRARGGASTPVRRAPAGTPVPTEAASRTTGSPSQQPATQACATPAPPSGDPVMWHGKAFSAEGFLLDADDWDEALAQAMAEALGVELTEEHWQVVLWARQAYLDSGASPNVRRVASGTGLGTRRMYELFPRSPGKTTAMLAGIPKPAGCV